MGFGGFTAFLRRAEIYGYELLLVFLGRNLSQISTTDAKFNEKKMCYQPNTKL